MPMPASRFWRRLFAMNMTIVSGSRGAGKTTFLRAYTASMDELGRSVGGVASPAAFDGTDRIGYDLLDLRVGIRRALARVVTSGGARPDIGPYRFDNDAIAAANAAIISAVRDELDVVAIDEVGPLEFRGDGLAPALEIALRECCGEQELIVVVRQSLLDSLPTRFPCSSWPSATVVSPPPSQPP